MLAANSGGEGALSWLGKVLVIVVGWLVVHHLSAKRDLSKARREMVVSAVGQLIGAAEEIYEAAHEYHLSARDEVRERHIKMTLSDLSMNLGGVAPICRDNGCLAVCRGAVIDLRKAITQRHFEDEHKGSLPVDAPQLDQILAAVMALKSALMTLRNQQYANET